VTGLSPMMVRSGWGLMLATRLRCFLTWIILQNLEYRC
jgi:hypothetical protein